jgi:hypothetical protein
VPWIEVEIKAAPDAPPDAALKLAAALLALGREDLRVSEQSAAVAVEIDAPEQVPSDPWAEPTVWDIVRSVCQQHPSDQLPTLSAGWFVRPS